MHRFHQRSHSIDLRAIFGIIGPAILDEMNLQEGIDIDNVILPLRD
jgi:hypothetical protein